MRMVASRIRDFSDLGTMLGLASEEELARVRGIVTRYTPKDAKDLESLIYLGQMEMGESPGAEGHTAAAA